MRTFAFLIAFASSLAFAQGAPPPGQGGPTLPDSQKCQMKCATEMQKCMAPCMPKNTADMDKPGAKNNMASCTKRCAQAQMPCMNRCSNAGKGKKGGGGGEVEE
jgi:hypothetical protein